MKGWVLDTNILSETRRPNPSRATLDWMASVPKPRQFTTTVNIAELRFGIETLPDAETALLLANWLGETIRPMFHGRILDADEDAIVKWRLIGRDMAQKRLPTPPADLLIAAIAILHGLGVATRDTAPFVASGVPVLNPFTGERFNGA